MSGLSLFEKVWREHVIASLGGGFDLLHVDRHLQHDLGGGRSLQALRKRGLAVRNPELTFATADHVVSSEPGRSGGAHDWANVLIDDLRLETKRAGVRLFDVGTDTQGIVHVIAPELGLTLPGTLVVCGDSHTCTNGALGAIGFGIGATEIVHVLATQTIVQRKPKTLRATFEGTPPRGVYAKDLILALIGKIGAVGGVGYAAEYAGPAVRSLDMEARLTMCNLSIELGAKIGMIAPDEATFAWLADRPFAPVGAAWDRALAHWRTLPSDADARFDREVSLDCSTLAPQVTWGTSPEDVIGVDQAIPQTAKSDALAYMGVQAGARIAGTKVDRVFIGSCTNSRLSDLQAAARVARQGKVARHVTAWVVPGSMAVKRAAEREGLHEVFRAAGFEWREPGCSMCVGANGELVEPEARCVSTSNRNFVGRQGPRARTHLASPATAAACALAGEICDVRTFLER
ncbi:MAG TPA: 3-isopropylmalate dehydratase large subunit [Burkholderiales bacterium]|nr:3-isopropylmalate dehydratase large subunit [Burkholderiales bacterium]